MTKALRVFDYLAHALRAIERIERYTVNMNEAGFLTNDLVQDAVIRNIEIIGEASNNVQRTGPEFAEQHDDIPWQVMYTMRNRVSHGYDKVDLKLVWKTIQRDLPGLYAQLREAQNSIPRAGG